MFIYTSPDMGGAVFSAAVQPAGDAISGTYSDYSIVITPEGVEGLTVGAALADQTIKSASSVDLEETTIFVTYAVGSFTIGVQSSEYDHDTATSDTDSMAIGISYAVNDDMSISYNMHDLETESTSDQDQESTGISASFTSGGLTLAGSMNEVENIAGTTTRDSEGYEVTLTFAF